MQNSEHGIISELLPPPRLGRCEPISRCGACESDAPQLLRQTHRENPLAPPAREAPHGVGRRCGGAILSSNSEFELAERLGVDKLKSVSRRSPNFREATTGAARDSLQTKSGIAGRQRSTSMQGVRSLLIRPYLRTRFDTHARSCNAWGSWLSPSVPRSCRSLHIDPVLQLAFIAACVRLRVGELEKWIGSPPTSRSSRMGWRHRPPIFCAKAQLSTK
jgi:hypothetical protein